ncbi:MAG: HAMP domain-containing histidine kinase [Nitrospirae bacterium]|nr:HAMP domain-containing histidine kinase [Nitrospirota bacterium]
MPFNENPAALLTCLAAAVGMVAAGVFYYLKALITSRFANVMLGLSALNERVQFDAQVFLSEIPSYLKKIWVKDFAFSISHGDTKFKKELLRDDAFIGKFYDNGDLSVSFTIVPFFCRGALKTLYALVLEHIFLIIKQDALMKIRTLNDSMTNVLKVQVFVQHDIKNIAQFIQTSYYNLQNLKDESDELRYVRYLKDSYAPLMLKANKIINTLELRPSDKPVNMMTIKIEAVLEQLVSLYHLDCEIKGEGSVYANEGTIFLIFDNLVKNMYDKYLEEELELSIEIIDEGDRIRVSAHDTGSPISDMGKIFEPFYSTKAGGSGVGLFQIKAHVTKLGGTVTARNVENGVIFDVTLPKSPAAGV